MPYKIFISFTLQEKEFAEKIRNILNNSFDGKILFFFSPENILSGEKWKKTLQIALKEYDAIISILTPKFLEKPWAYIEWSSFWINDKPTFLLLTDDVVQKNLVAPMQDTQVVQIFNEDDVLKFIKALAISAECDYVPFHICSDIVNNSKIIYNKILEQNERSKYSVFKSDLSLLPDDDFEKKDIFWYFYEKEKDHNTSFEIFNKIQLDSLKTSILLALFAKNEFDSIDKLYQNIEQKGNLLPLFRNLIKSDLENNSLTEKLLRNFHPGASNIKFCLMSFIDNNKREHRLLNSSVKEYLNSAELKNLIIYDSDTNNNYDIFFENCLDVLSNKSSAEYRNTLRYLFFNSQYSKNKIKEHIIRLAKQNESEAEKFLAELLDSDIETFEELFLKKSIITLEIKVNRLNELYENKIKKNDSKKY